MTHVARDLMKIAIEAATSAGRIIQDSWRDAHRVRIKSTSTDPVTEVDERAETQIRSVIASHRPFDRVIGEEQGDSSGLSDIYWMVDPIDGTVNYIYGRDEVAVSIAALDINGPVASCVYLPRFQRTFSAVRGEGAWLGKEPLKMSPPPQLSEALLGTGFSYHSAGRAEQMKKLSRVLPEVRDLRRSGSAAIDLCSLANGSLDVFIEDDLEEWDWAGASLIVLESGGSFLRFTSDRGTSGVVAGCTSLVRQVLDLWTDPTNT